MVVVVIRELVLTLAAYNGLMGLMQPAPIASGVKGYPFEVGLPAHCGVSGVVLADHARSMDWRIRRVEFIAEASAEVLFEVRGQLGRLLGFGLT